MTPDELREIARVLDEEGKKLVEQGEPVKGARAFKTAQDYREAAKALEGLRPGESTDSLQDVTQAQLARRARSIAAGKAGTDARKAAIVSRWETLGKAATALRISPQALSGYLSGLYPCPENVARRVEKETGLPADTRTWPKGLTK